MNRPFLYVGFSFFAALILVLFLSPILRVILVLLFLMAFVFVLIFGKFKLKKTLSILLMVFISVPLAIFAHMLISQADANTAEKFVGKEMSVYLRLVDYPKEQNSKFYYTAEVISAENKDGGIEFSPFKIRLTSNFALFCEPYDYLECNAVFYDFKQNSGFSSKSSFLANGTLMAAYMKSYETYNIVKSSDKPLGNFFIELARNLSIKAEEMFASEEASVVKAMLLGDKHAVSAEITENFRTTGTSHLLVVSGGHLAALSYLVMLILKSFRVPNRLASITTIFIIIMFVGVTGATPSILRSGIMYIVFLLGGIFGKETDAKNSLGFAVFAMCVFNPHIGGDVGFILSVFSTFGIIVLEERIRKWLMKPIKNEKLSRLLLPAVASLSVTLSATLFILPVLVYVFGGVSLITPLANLLLVAPSMFFIYFSLAALLLFSSYVFVPFSYPFILITGLLSKYMLWITRLLERLKFAYINLDEGTSLIILSGVMLIIGVLALGKKASPKNTRIAVIMIIFLLFCGAGSYEYKHKDNITIAIADEGDKSSVVLMKDRRAAVLTFEGYNSSGVVKILDGNNIDVLESILITSSSAQATASCNKTLDKYTPKNVVISNETFLYDDMFGKFGAAKRTYFNDYVKYEVLDGVMIEVSGGGRWIRFKIGKREIILENGETQETSCDFLITNMPETNIKSAFTVLQTNDIIVPYTREGLFFLMADDELFHSREVYFDFTESGEFSARRER